MRLTASQTRRFCWAFLFGIILPFSWAEPGFAAKRKSGPELALKFLRSQISPAGLIDSYVEDLTDDSYTYDNALAAMAFLAAGDKAAAERILDAFAAIGPQPEGGFLDRYHAQDGLPNGILAAGPNAYLLQAMNVYQQRTGETRYVAIAGGIVQYLLSLQDTDGGLVGQAGVAWKSTENNLGALAAIYNFGILNDDPASVDRAQAIRAFLARECWNGTRFLRGENDSIIVTDVQALGPIVLGATYASSAYWAKGYTLTTKRRLNRRITGFDSNADRDTVWTEGTLQESLAFLAIGDVKKSARYKAEMEKLFQSSGALLLASNTGTTDSAWVLQPWQAVAPTAWYVYVSFKDNVLRLLP